MHLISIQWYRILTNRIKHQSAPIDILGNELDLKIIRQKKGRINDFIQDLRIPNRGIISNVTRWLFIEDSFIFPITKA